MAGNITKTADPSQSATQKHNALYENISRELNERMPEYRLFQAMARTCLPRGQLAATQNVVDILKALEKENWIRVGNYDCLKQILEDARLRQLKNEVAEKEGEIVQGKKPKIEKVISDSQRSHCKLYGHVHDHLTNGMPHYPSFLIIVRTCLNQGTLDTKKDNALDILEALEIDDWISFGHYENLITILEDAELRRLAENVRQKQQYIQDAMKAKGQVKFLEHRVREISESRRSHFKLYDHVNRNLTKKMHEFGSFVTIAGSYLDTGILRGCENSVDVLCALETAGKITIGDYEVLETILRGAYLLQLEGQVKERARSIAKEV